VPSARAARAAAFSSLSALIAGSALAAPPIGRAPFVDPLNPPSYRSLDATESARVELGLAVFNTQWVPAGTAGAARRDGLGPLFNAASCDACHNNGARGRGPGGDGLAPPALVIQLATRAPDGNVLPRGDPVYGRVFNTAALPGVPPEGVVTIRYQELPGRYPDGATWSLRSPRYELTGLSYGPLMPGTLIKPRLAPALFGVGLLESVPQGLIRPQGDRRPPGRFGWQGEVSSIREQSAKAFALEMGLTSSDYPRDDCTSAQPQCLHQPDGGSPEVSGELFDALLAFQSALAVPQARTPSGEGDDPGASLFGKLGCTVCHTPRLPVPSGMIAPYTDLSLHDLGAALADATVAGVKVASRWRTAPLWGAGYRPRSSGSPTLLHDGRARSIEEAILWHDGEGRSARERFERLAAAQRRALLAWLEGL